MALWQVLNPSRLETNVSVKRVVLYTGSDSLSVLARNYLIKIHVEFEEIDAAEEKGFGMLVKRSKQTKTPFLEVRRSSSVGTVVGFDEFLYASALNPTLSYDKFVMAKQRHDENAGSGQVPA